MEGAIAALKKAMAGAKKRAAAKIRAKKAKDAAKGKKCRGCTDDYGTQLPADGTWKNGTKGDGEWEPDWDSERGKAIQDANVQAGLDPKTPVTFKEGYPDLSNHAYNHNGKPAIVEIDNMTGKGSDFTQANNEMKKIDPNWKKEPDGWTWHHKEDGVTMELVPSDMHSKTGIPHAGGRFVVQDPGY